jgi:hypothetical protein
VTHDDLRKFVFVVLREFHQPADFKKEDLFQKVHVDMVCRSAPVILFPVVIVRAVEILDFIVPLIEMEVHIVAAVRADEQSRKHILLSVFCLAFPGFAALYPYHFKYFTLYDRLVDILVDHPIFRVVLPARLVLIGFAVRLEVDFLSNDCEKIYENGGGTLN